MVASSETKSNKTAFITAHLGKNPTANRKSVLEAWAKAGNSGTVSPTLVSKLRREMGLAGNLRGRPRLNGLNGAPKAKSEGANTKKAKGSTVAHAYDHTTSTGSAKSTEGASIQVIDEVDAGIDHLMFTLKLSGGMPEVEAALRAARRLLPRSDG